MSRSTVADSASHAGAAIFMPKILPARRRSKTMNAGLFMGH
ncbi:MAG: hypothetical protein BWY12_02667 [candidate division BRC1 bacterium ADurb.Bin183]|nr:MAG: hypothetical protein BWY12_02667 [candidate division BRC1 bacterium ADurb.Bin183]